MKKEDGLIWMPVLLVVLLLISPSGAGFSTEAQSPHLQRKVITVDDEPGDADYSSIQEALNYSNSGDTIEVYSGIYYEHGIMIIKENISLIGIPYELGNGSDIGKPFIEGQGLADVIHVHARNSTITGFQIENNGGGAYSDVTISNGSNGCILSNNELSNSLMAVVGCGASYSKIINNTISHSGMRQGILLWGQHILVSGNNISYVTEGISIWGAWNCTYIGNTISRCYDYGIVIYGTGYITVSHNTIKDNPIGILIDASGKNLIEKNNFINNDQQAYFNQELGFTAGNRWMQNYWGQPRLLPYPIRGIVFLVIPWVQFDWRPALRPYNIS